MKSILDLFSTLSGIPLILLLIGGGLYLTIRLDFIQFRHFGLAMRETIGKMLTKDEGEGTITPFQAAASALAVAVGAGNITGVAVAIALGGPGAIFWMWVAAFIGMATKYTEIVLGMKYRVMNEKGDYVGGPMYYIDKGLGSKALALLKAIVTLFAIFASLSVQSNALAGTLKVSFNVPVLATGIIVTLAVFIITLGGIKSIGKFAEKIVPSMAVLYVGAVLIVIVMHISNLPHALGLIFKHAFTPLSAFGGFGGAGIAVIVRQGIARGLYSNDAGTGAAAYTHSSARNNHPTKQGLWGIFEVFFDTIVICTITALLILTTGAWKTLGTGEAAAMAGAALSTTFGRLLGGGIATVSLGLFSFTTILAVVYAGEKNAEYLFGHKASVGFRFVYIAGILIGAISNLVLLWSLLDIAFVLNIIPNMIALIYLGGEVKKITDDYFPHHHVAGQKYR